MNTRIRIALLLVNINVLYPAPADRVTIASKGRATATIVAGGDSSAAAKELAAFLRKITGAEFSIRTPAQKPSGTLIVVGGDAARARALGPEGFRIDTESGNLLLNGADDAGTEFAVYTFLEKYLGVRWFWPGELGEVVPREATVTVGPIHDAEKPDFKWRNRGPGGALWGAASGPTEMRARERVMGISAEHQRQVALWEKRNKWGGWKIYGGHSLGEIFPPEKYAAAHPEYYALVNGKRDAPGADYDFKHRGQICTSNPAVVEIAAAWVNAFFDAHPDYQAVHITMNDGGGFCECDVCRRLDSGRVLKSAGIDAEETKGGAKNIVITDRIFTFVNRVSERVQRRHPGKFVVSMAYSRYLLPPEKIEIEPYVIPEYTQWSAYMHANPELKREHEAIAAGWAKAARTPAVYEYFVNGSWPGMHRLVEPYIAESIRYLKKQGIEMYQMQSGDEFGTNGMNYYVAGKLLWNAALDERELLDDFYARAFGPAGPAMRRHQDRMRNAWTAATRDGRDVSCNSLETTRLLELFTPELLQGANSDLDEAAKAAGGEIVRKRVAFFRRGLQYTELTADAVRAAKKGPAEAAIQAIEKRDRFVEELKNDFVLPYFWVKYNEAQRARFLPLARLKAQLK